jgi:site-specific recombinase XerD
MPVLKLTQEGISKLRCPEGKRSVQICDAQHRGLLLELRSKDRDNPTWYVRYKDQSKRTKYVRLGHFPSVSLADARARAKDVQAEIRLGADPRAEENAKKAVPTFSEFFEEQYIPLVKPRKRTWKKDLEYFELRLKAEFGNKRLNQITRHQIQTFHTRLKNEELAASTCNHYLKLTHRIFQICQDFSLVEKNPAARIPHFKEENMIENYLTDEELKRFVNVLRTDDNRNVCNILLLLLNTGCRVNEILSLSWTDCDLENRVIRITAQNSKSRSMRSIPLNSGAVDILRKQALITQDLGFCYVNFQSGKRYTTISKVFQRIKERARVNIRLHDLRHNFASMLINDGCTLYEVQQILGHSNPKVTQRYAHLTAKTLEAAANCASNRIDDVMKGTA